jgi:hypothetical protein
MSSVPFVCRVGLVLLAIAMVGPAVAQGLGVTESLPIAVGSWTWGNAYWEDGGFDQIKWVWRLDLSSGELGPWESPYVDTFTNGLWWNAPDPGTPEASWSLSFEYPYYCIGSGNLVGAGENNWFSYNLHFAGNWADDVHAGFNMAAYRNGSFVFGATRYFGFEGSVWFSEHEWIDEATFDSYPPVPEPTWLSVVGLALLGVVEIRRRRRKA